MDKYRVELGQQVNDIFSELDNFLRLLSHLIFDDTAPEIFFIKSSFQLNDLRFLFREDLDSFFKKPLTIVYFNNDSLDFFDIKKRKHIEIVSYSEFSEYYQINFEERCLVISQDRNVLIFSDFNDFQILLFTEKSPLYNDGILANQKFNDFSYSDFEFYKESEVKFFQGVLARQRAWNHSQG